MFGESKMIDESCCDMIDEMDTDIVDDIRDAKRRSASSASHLCDEGHSHDSTDRRISAAYNNTPRTSPSPQTRQQVSSQNTSPYPAPSLAEYTPQASTLREHPVERTVVNGRTFERPAEAKKQTPAQAKAGKAFLAFAVIGIILSCFGSILMFPVCIILGMYISASAKKCEGDDTSKVNQAIALSIMAMIAALVLIFAGHQIFDLMNDLFSSTGGTQE